MKYFYVIPLALFLLSCNKKEDSRRNYHFGFYPRTVKTIWSDYIYLKPEIEDDQGNMTYSFENFTGNELKSDNLILGVYTSNLNLDTVGFDQVIKDNYPGREELRSRWPLHLTHSDPLLFLQGSDVKNSFIDDADVSMEEKIKNSYTKYANSFSTGSSEWSSPPIFQDYRLTEVRKMTITSNVTLFNKEAGSVLNQYFLIYLMEPLCTFSGNKQLTTDHFQTKKELEEGLSIEKWLSHKPISAVYFYFRLISVPSELPLENVSFNIVMETIDGDLLECSSKPIKINR